VRPKRGTGRKPHKRDRARAQKSSESYLGRAQAILAQAILAQAILAQAILAQAILAQAWLKELKTAMAT